MTRVKTVRVWKNVERAAESGKLSSRLTTMLDIDWNRFDRFKEYLFRYISRFHHQTATAIHENRMVLALLKAGYHLLRCGFYTSAEVVNVIPTLLRVLDGTGDHVGLQPKGEASTARYKVRVSTKVDTLVIMECKLWCCRVLLLVCTMRWISTSRSGIGPR